MRQHSYLNSAKKVIGAYDGREPFPSYLKKYFAANKKYGSRDRKQVAALCYHFYRLGKALPAATIDERIISGTFLCEQHSNDFLQFHKPQWNDLVLKPAAEKIALTGLTVEDIFPWREELSDGIDLHSFCYSFFIQPDLFLRIRPGKKDMLIKKLNDAGLSFELKDEHCIALPNASKLDAVIEPDKEAVIQDMNSQQVLNFLNDPVSGIQHPVSSIRYPVSVWDCCAASGGKSILAYDVLDGKIELTVSDIRESILSNLKKRFKAAGVNQYHSFLTNLTSDQFPIPNLPAGRQGSQFQLIICDAPCTGSGTWSRTPEQLYYFKEEAITENAAKQRKIVSNVIPQLKNEGIFIYITCSVFKKENEEIVHFIKEQFHLQLLQMELLKGYDKNADSMFVAVFQKK